MKTLDAYMKLPYKMEIVPDTEEGGYVVSFPELPGCLTCADTLEQAVINGEDAKREWITAAMEEGIDIPEPVSLDDYSGQFKLRIPKSLHHALATHAKEEGTSRRWMATISSTICCSRGNCSSSGRRSLLRRLC